MDGRGLPPARPAHGRPLVSVPAWERDHGKALGRQACGQAGRPSRPSGGSRRWPVEGAGRNGTPSGGVEVPAGDRGRQGSPPVPVGIIERRRNGRSACLRLACKRALEGAKDRGARVEALMSGPRVRWRGAAEGRIGAPLGQACKSVGRGRKHPGHYRTPSPRLDGSRSSVRLSSAICVPERQAHPGRPGAGATSTRLLATWVTILILSPTAVLTCPDCGPECGYDRDKRVEYDAIPICYALSSVDLGSTILQVSVNGDVTMRRCWSGPRGRTALRGRGHPPVTGLRLAGGPSASARPRS